MEELRTLVLYDVVNDKPRLKISEACLDFGLTRIQYSAFAGRLTRNKRQELFLRLRSLLEGESGKIFIQPVCGRDADEMLLWETDTAGEGEANEVG